MNMRNLLKPGAACMSGAALCMILGSGPVAAADASPAVTEKLTGLGPGIEMLRAEVGQDRRDVVAAAMLLTASERDIFWPLYDQYRAAQHALGDKRLKLIAEFVANRQAMTEEEAAKLTKQAIALDRSRIDIKADYIDRMSKVLSARTVARFFQIDSRLDVAVDARLAARIPLVE